MRRAVVNEKAGDDYSAFVPDLPVPEPAGIMDCMEA